MSISSYITILELHDLEEDTFDIIEATNFLNNNEGIYSFIFQLLEIKYRESNLYLLVYVSYQTEYGVYIKPFQFSNANFNSFTSYNERPIVRSGNYRITSSFVLSSYNLIAIFYMYNDWINFNIINYELNTIYNNNSFIKYQGQDSYQGKGVFFKALNLNDTYAAFVYFYNERYFKFNILFYNENTYTFHVNKVKDFSQTSYSSSITLNEFIKIDNNRVVMLSIFESLNPHYLSIICFDLYDDYKKIITRSYMIDYHSENINTFSTEISAFLYSDFLIFTGTLSQINENGDISILILFGYPNGTDFELDISSYFIDSDNFNESKNLFNDLMDTMIIENNIFGYQKVEKIKLVSIPDEILLYNENDELLSSNRRFDVNYKLKQNDNLIKENKYYYLEYQFIVKEFNYPDFYENRYLQNANMDDANDFDLGTVFNPKTFYGRTNTLKFKLCHKFCKTCRKIGISDSEQNCELCLEEYSYNYNDIFEFSNICIPQGYFYDYEQQTIIQCTISNSKFYTDITSNKTFCLKDDYVCPIDYQNYDEATKECKYSNINSPSTLVKNIDLNELTELIDFNSDTHLIKNDSIASINESNSIFSINESNSIVSINETNSMVSINENNSIVSINENIKKKIDTELIKNYTINDESLEIKGENNTIFQLTTTGNEINRFTGSTSNENGVSIIDLGTCEIALKTFYNINLNISLIIKKYEKLTIPSERNVQYEVYHPFTKEKLNLSLCDSDSIDLYIPINLNDELLELYEDLKSSGYDLFNINDPFYNDLCSPYKSKNGTDVLLSDRKNDYYSNNNTTCQSNCQYSSFNSEYKFLKCECKVIVDDIDINDFHKFSKKVYKNFYDILKNSNYKTLKCYKLVFNSDYLKKNIGSFVVLSFFILYVIFFIVYIFKGISPLKEEVMNTIYTKFKDTKIDIQKSKDVLVRKSILKINKGGKNKIVEFPPKKVKIKPSMTESNISLKKKKKKRNYLNNKKVKSINNTSTGNINKISINDKDKIIVTETKKSLAENNTKNRKPKNKRKPKVKINTDNMSKSDMNFKDKHDIINTNNEILDDLDLNNLPYEKAVDLDKRTFIQIYWSRLKSKHLIIYTFISCNDHNLVYIKISRFLFLVCTSMAMNVIFFFDSSMHKIYIDYGKYNIIQQIPQIIYSSLVSLIIEILIGILSFTDKNIYEIRQLQEFNTEKIEKSLKNIKIKLILFLYFSKIFRFFLN